MYKIAVSPEQLIAFACKVKEFKRTIILECESLQQQADAIRPFVDERAGLALVRPVEEIINIVTDKEDSLKEIIYNAYAYAGAVHNIQQKLTAERERQNALKEKICGIACGAVMHERIKAADSDYQTMNGYTIGKIKSIVDGAATAVEVGTGVAIKPQLAPTDKAHIDGQVDNVIKLIDSQIALKNLNKVIDRSGTPIPQEQIDSHTLVVDHANEPWKVYNKN